MHPNWFHIPLFNNDSRTHRTPPETIHFLIAKCHNDSRNIWSSAFLTYHTDRKVNYSFAAANEGWKLSKLFYLFCLQANFFLHQQMYACTLWIRVAMHEYDFNYCFPIYLITVLFIQIWSWNLTWLFVICNDALPARLHSYNVYDVHAPRSSHTWSLETNASWQPVIHIEFRGDALHWTEFAVICHAQPKFSQLSCNWKCVTPRLNSNLLSVLSTR